MELEELEEFITLYGEELTKDELEAIKASEEEEGSEEEEEMTRPNLTVKFLPELLQDMRAVADGLQDADPVMQRYLRF